MPGGNIGRVDGARVGADLRLLRVRRGWRQIDLAQRVGCSQSEVSRVERGQVAGVPVGRLDAIARALGAQFIGTVVWRGERLDRIRDTGHAALVDQVIRLLQSAGWLVMPEVSFAIYGERGSIDILAFHPGTRVLLVVEVKTAFGDVQATLSTLDRKERLAARIGRDHGWDAVAVSVLLAVADTSTNRRLVSRHAPTFAAAYPIRGHEARRLLTSSGPSSLRALVFLSSSRGTTRNRAARVRIPRHRGC